MAESELLVLIDDAGLDHRGYVLHFTQELGIAALFQCLFERWDRVEVVVGGFLPAGDYEDDVLDARVCRLTHGELDCGFVEHG